MAVRFLARRARGRARYDQIPTKERVPNVKSSNCDGRVHIFTDAMDGRSIAGCAGGRPRRQTSAANFPSPRAINFPAAGPGGARSERTL